jgi:hypothetical protein
MVRALAATCLSVLAVFLGACGGSDNTPYSPPPKQHLVGQKEKKGLRPGSPERALMDYWAALQFQAWPQAVGFFDPSLRDFIGASRITQALQARTSTFQISAPEIVRVARKGAVTTVYYKLALPDSNLLESTSWRRIAGGWRIFLDSGLDDALQSQAEKRVDGPSRSRPSPKALRAGRQAAALQSRFLQRHRHQLD